MLRALCLRQRHPAHGSRSDRRRRRFIARQGRFLRTPSSARKSIYNLALQGDEHARRIFRTFGRYLGILLAALINVLNLDMFVIGGGVSSAWDAFAPTMFTELRTRSLVYAATAPDAPSSQPIREEPPSAAQAEQSSAVAHTAPTDRNTIITRALLGSDAGLYGAARAAVLPS